MEKKEEEEEEEEEKKRQRATVCDEANVSSEFHRVMDGVKDRNIFDLN